MSSDESMIENLFWRADSSVYLYRKRLSVFKRIIPSGFKKFRYLFRNSVPVRRFLALFICGSANVIHISEISFSPNSDSMNSIRVLINRALPIDFSVTNLAPFHRRAPLISIPIKFLSGYCMARETVYSPFPHPSSNTIGLSLPHSSFPHLPLYLYSFESNSSVAV